MPLMKKNAACISFLFLLTLAFFAEAVFTGNTFIARDTYLFYNPRQCYAAESMLSGVLPLWNPYVACGVPFHANLQSALFYPLSIIYHVLPFQQGFKYFIVLHYFLGAAFMFILMREWAASRKAALLAGIVFAFGGYLTSIQDNVAFLAAGIWLPLILFCFHRSAVTGRLCYTILTGGCIAAQIFAGDASFFLLSSFLSTALYAVYQSSTQTRGSTKKIVGALVLAWAIGLSLSAVQLIPFLEFAAHSHRFPGLSFAQATKWSYHPLELLQFLIPYPFGTTVPITRWFGQLWLDTVYIGIFPLLLACLGLARDKKKMHWFLAALVIINLILSFGAYTPLYKALHSIVPVFQMLQYPVKFLFLVGFALAVLAGRGLDLLFNTTGSRQKPGIRGLLLSGLIAALALALLAVLARGEQLYAAFLQVYPSGDYLKPLAQKQFYALLSGLSLALIGCLFFALLCLAARKKKLPPNILITVIFTVVAVDLWLAKPEDPLISQAVISRPSATATLLHRDQSLFRVYSLARFYVQSFSHLYNVPFDRSYQFLRESLRANLNMHEHIASVEEYSEMLNRSFYDLFLPVEAYFSQDTRNPELLAYCRMLFNLLNVKYIISPLPRPDLGFTLIADQPLYIYKNEQVLPRAFFPQQVETFSTAGEVLARMQQPGFDPKRTACFVSQQQEGGALSSPESGQDSTSEITWSAYASQQSSLTTDRQQPGLLVVSDSFYPGWKAFVDGTEAPLLKVNYFMRGIIVDKGRHQVLFVFQPPSFTLGCWISALVLLLSLGCLLASLRQERQKKCC